MNDFLRQYFTPFHTSPFLQMLLESNVVSILEIIVLLLLLDRVCLVFELRLHETYIWTKRITDN
jgi:hypothetical protein